MAIKSTDKFIEAISLAENLYNIDKENYANPPKIAEQVLVQGLRGGAAVLAVAAFEMFLKDLFEKQLSRLTGTPPPIEFDLLPSKLKENSVFYLLELRMKGPRYETPIPRIDRLPGIFNAFSSLDYGVITPSVFADTGSNPNPKTIVKMFKDIGVNDLFLSIKPSFDTKWSSSTHATFIEDKLNEIVQRRHIVAHTADALNISRSDLIETFKFLKILSELLEKKMEEYIDNILSSCI